MTIHNRCTGGFAELDFSEFAQEFLRRNPAYRGQFERALPAGCRKTARSWGLEFPG